MITAIFIILSFCLAYMIWGGKKAFCIFFIYYLLDSGLSLSPSITVRQFLLYFFLIALFFQPKNSKEKFPFWLCTIVTIFSITISAVFASNISHWGMSIKNIVSSVAMPYCFFRYVNSSKQTILLSRLFVFTTFFLAFYSILELVLNENPIRSFVVDQSGTDIEVTDKFRYGIKRVQAVFIHPTSCGYYFVTMFSFFILFFSKKLKKQANISSVLYVLAIGGCLLITFLTGTRAAILSLALFIIYLFMKMINVRNIIPLLLAVCTLSLFVIFLKGGYIIEVFDSIVHPNSADVGSSGDMRERQLEIALLYWSMSPFIGLGPGMTFDEVTVLYEDMYGAESVWFPLMIDYGILGCIAYLLCYVDSFRLMWKIRKEIVVFLLLLLIINTATSVPGFEYTFILCMTIFAYRIEQFNNLSRRM